MSGKAAGMLVLAGVAVALIVSLAGCGGSSPARGTSSDRLKAAAVVDNASRELDEKLGSYKRHGEWERWEEHVRRLLELAYPGEPPYVYEEKVRSQRISEGRMDAREGMERREGEEGREGAATRDRTKAEVESSRPSSPAPTPRDCGEVRVAMPVMLASERPHSGPVLIKASGMSCGNARRVVNALLGGEGHTAVTASEGVRTVVNGFACSTAVHELIRTCHDASGERLAAAPPKLWGEVLPVSQW